MFGNGSAKTAVLMATAILAVTQVPRMYAWGDDRHYSDRPDGFYTRHYLPHGEYVDHLSRDFVRMFIGGLEYFYWEGMFYQMRADRYVVVPAPVGAVVTAVPPGCQPVIVDGTTYYTINGVTYMYTPNGYQVVPPPMSIVRREPVSPTVLISQQAPNISAKPPAPPPATTKTEDVYTVNIPNVRGTYTPVTLRRSGNGFVGPQGEYYTEFPRIEQLKVMYGK